MAHRPKNLLDQVREALRLTHDSMRTEDSSVAWITRDLRVHHTRPPHERASAAIEACLTHLAVDHTVAAATHHHALRALWLLSRGVLNRPLDRPIDARRAKKPTRLPTGLTQEETRTVVERLSGTPRCMAKRLCGGG